MHLLVLRFVSIRNSIEVVALIPALPKLADSREQVSKTTEWKLNFCLFPRHFKLVVSSIIFSF